MMGDPLNTTAADGRPCHQCGADAVWVPVITEGFQLHDIPLCGDCTDTQTTVCPRCGDRIWMADGRRIFSTPDLYCGGCEAEINTALAEHALRADIALDDDFNKERR